MICACVARPHPPCAAERPLQQLQEADDTAAMSAAELVPDGHSELQIVVADRGHVWVGRVAASIGSSLLIKRARVVRRWGTSRGLNQLAVEGPQADTRLDAPADVIVAKRAIIARIPCTASTWPEAKADG